MFPLSAVLFPHGTVRLHVFEPRYLAMVRDCLAADARFGVVLIERGSEVGGGDHRAMLGTRGVIARAATLLDGRWLLEVRGEAVVQVEEWLPDDPYPQATVHAVEERSEGSGELTELVTVTTGRVRRARALLAEHGGGAPLPPDAVFDGGGDVAEAAWRLCGEAPVSAYDAHRLLAAAGPAERLQTLARLMEELELDLERMLTAE